MVVKVYISGMSGNKEVKKRQQRVTMIMDSKHIEYSIIDITEPGQEGEKDFMQTNAQHKGCTISDPNPRHALPPQLFNDTEYCGDYDDFDLANEVDSLEVFLKLAAPAPAVAVVPVETEHKNGDAADDENKENKTEANKDDNAADGAEDAGDAVDGPNEREHNLDEVMVEEETNRVEAQPEAQPEANGQSEGVDEEANSSLVSDNDATKDDGTETNTDPSQSVGEIDKEPDGSIVENSESLSPGPDEETPDKGRSTNVDETEQNEAETEPQKDDAVEDNDSEHGTNQHDEEELAVEQTSERQEQATEEVNKTTDEEDRAAQKDHTEASQQDADTESNPESHPVDDDPVEPVELAAEPEEQVTALPGSKDELDDAGGSDDDRSQSRRSSTDEQEEIEDVRPPTEDRPASPAHASKDVVEVRPVAGDGAMEADGSDTEEQELLRASAALAGQSEDAQEIIEVDEPLEEAEDTGEQQTGAGEEEISSKLVDTDDPMLAEQEQEE
ncbi:retinitis pigmentosa 1-like 1 protein isoform X1 [Anopheles bellator]|uniref:retinitis pigmentosa 1-like 1 protein isoform X1 n=1 Tax=Anopheles bellator TaxID=139047 RepID=UPI0026498136|nr:retinitis pigmentosa 1-like 1 protein isoform X1 [Anopheles bellator]XP_058053627.1 retinitis pigmentosa 1-like 1 protein isoform X1 [Anopheles bellator]XP_058053628.1 retinitis pigmentosa 1-like 1 protein isoform X1 [Anopheles bellator]